MSGGSMRQRSPGSWELKYEAGTDPVTGKRRSRFKTVKGSKREAQQELRRLLGQVDDGTHADPGKLTLGDYLDRWLAGHRSTISPSTAELYEGLIKRHLQPCLGHLPLAKLTTLAINAFYTDRLTNGRLDGRGGLSAQMVRHLDRLLHVALRDAVRQRLIARNPVDEAKSPRVERKARKPLSDDEFNALIDTARGTRFYAPLLTLLGTGLRRGELLALTWRHVDLCTSVLHVVAAIEETQAGGARIKDPKTAAGRRRVDMPGFAVEALKDHRRQQQEEHLALGIGWTADTLVFGDPLGRIWNGGIFSRSFTRLAKRAGVPGFTPHKARHEHFSRLLAAGEHPKVCQLRAGHGSIAVTMDAYSHASEALQREAAVRIENTFTTIREQRGGNAVAKPTSSPTRSIVRL